MNPPCPGKKTQPVSGTSWGGALQSQDGALQPCQIVCWPPRAHVSSRVSVPSLRPFSTLDARTAVAWRQLVLRTAENDGNITARARSLDVIIIITNLDGRTIVVC